MVLVYNKNLDFVVVEEVGSFMVFMGRLGNYLFEFVLGYGIVVKKDILFVIW